MRKYRQNRRWRRCALPLMATALCVGGRLGAEKAPPVISQAQLNEFKIMNYYPAAQPGPNMWLNWNPNAIRADFDKMTPMQMNVIRLCVQPSAFGCLRPMEKK